MHLAMLLEMAASGMGSRIAFGSRDAGLSYTGLARRARRAATLFSGAAGDHVVLVDESSPAVPVALFGAAVAGKAFVPLNYRLADDRLLALVRRVTPAILVAGDGVASRLGEVSGLHVVARDEFLEATENETVALADPVYDDDADGAAVLLFTSGTTGDPKAAVLRHRHLAAYVIGSLDFASAEEDEAAVVCVPPYHVAAVSSVLSTTYVGRRVVQLDRFEPGVWVDAVRREHATHAMVVPTMLHRILDVVEADGGGLPSLRSLAYGGGPMPRAVVERALRLLGDVDMVNAYGLTETASTIAILGPEDHRLAFASTDPAVRSRLGSVGRPLPGVEVSIRDATGQPVPAGELGEVWVRGEQVSGEYVDADSPSSDGWFRTRDAGRLDPDGFLYVEGRLDDVIVRGGENLSPGEIEAVLLDHPDVEEAAVVGIPHVEWGESVAAAIVLRPDHKATEAELQAHVRHRLRSARTPQHIRFYDALPYNDTGKLLRRVLRTDLSEPAD